MIAEYFATLELKTDSALSSLSGVDQKIQSVGGTLDSVGKKGALATAPIIAGLTVATKEAIEFESNIAGVAKSLPDGGDIGELSSAIQMAAFDSLQGQDAQAQMTEELLKSGVAYKNLSEMMDIVDRSAVALDMSGKDAADQLLSIGAGFNIRDTPEKLRQISADMNMVADSAAVTSSQMMSFASDAASSANQAGVSSDVLLSIGGAMIDTGMEAGKAAIATDMLFSKITSGALQSKKAKQQLAKLGLPDNFSQQFKKDAPSALATFNDALSKSEDKAGALGLIFGLEQGRNIGRLFNNFKKYEKILGNVSDKEKSNAKFAGEYSRVMATTASQQAKFNNSIEATSSIVGSALLPVINDLMDSAKPLIKDFADWGRENQDTIASIAKMTLAIAALSAGAVAMGGAMSVLAFLVSPIGLVAAAVVGLTAAWANMDEILDYLEEKFPVLHDFLAFTLPEAFNNFADTLIGTDFSSVTQFFSETLPSALESTIIWIQKAITWYKNLISAVKEFFGIQSESMSANQVAGTLGERVGSWGRSLFTDEPAKKWNPMNGSPNIDGYANRTAGAGATTSTTSNITNNNTFNVTGSNATEIAQKTARITDATQQVGQ